MKKILSRKANETHWHELWSTTEVFDIEEARIFSPSLTVRINSQLG